MTIPMPAVNMRQVAKFLYAGVEQVRRSLWDAFRKRRDVVRMIINYEKIIKLARNSEEGVISESEIEFHIWNALWIARALSPYSVLCNAILRAQKVLPQNDWEVHWWLFIAFDTCP